MVFEPKEGIDLVDQGHDPLDLVLDLLFRHEDMGVVLGETAHPHQAVEGARQLVPVDDAQFPDPQRQVAVGAHLGLVYQDAARAVHGFDGEILVVDDGGIHVVLIMVPMPRPLPQGAAENDGGRAIS